MRLACRCLLPRTDVAHAAALVLQMAQRQVSVPYQLHWHQRAYLVAPPVLRQLLVARREKQLKHKLA